MNYNSEVRQLTKHIELDISALFELISNETFWPSSSTLSTVEHGVVVHT